MLKWVIWIVIALSIVILLIPVVVTQVEKYQHERNMKAITNMVPNEDDLLPDTSSVVIVFSRSGSTLVLANHIVNTTEADLVKLRSQEYRLGLLGWIRAMSDARSHVASISPETVDLTPFETVYLGSPIWLYSPAPPIWQFVLSNDFRGKKVILFNTYNSHYEQEYIDNFQSLIESKGAISFEHRPVLRGRMGSQISNDEMIKVYEQYNEPEVE